MRLLLKQNYFGNNRGLYDYSLFTEDGATMIDGVRKVEFIHEVGCLPVVRITLLEVDVQIKVDWSESGMKDGGTRVSSDD